MSDPLERSRTERRKSGGMFKKWFSSPAKPVLPGANTYGEPRSASRAPATNKARTQDNVRQDATILAAPRPSEDSAQRRPQTARENSTQQAIQSSEKADESNVTRNALNAGGRQDGRGGFSTLGRNASIATERTSSQYDQGFRRPDPVPRTSSHVSRTYTLQSQVDGADDSLSDSAHPEVLTEIDDLKSRIRMLELTGRQPSYRTSQVDSIPERPSTANTITSGTRSRQIPTSPLNEMKSPGYFSKTQSLLQTALGKAEQRVSRDVFSALEASAQDAMDLATLAATANTSTYSSSYTPDHPMTDKRLRRTADNLCRSLTELCLALVEDGTPSDMRSESRMSMRRPSRESLYQDSQAGRSSVTGYSSRQTRSGSVLAARNARAAEPVFDDGQSLASRQSAAHRRADSTSTITNDRFADQGFRFNDDDMSTTGRISRTTSNAQNTSAPRDTRQYARDYLQKYPLPSQDDYHQSPRNLGSKYSTSSLRDHRIAEEVSASGRLHALTSDRAETRSPLAERQARDRERDLSTPQSQHLHPSSSYANTPSTTNNAVYELPTHISPHDRHNDTSGGSTSTSGASSAVSPEARNGHSAFPFPSSPTAGAEGGNVVSSPIQIPGRGSAPTSPGAGGTAGSYSSTLTQRIMERRLQQAKEKQHASAQTGVNSTAVLGTSLPAGGAGTHSLLNGLPSAGGGGGGGGAGGGRLGSMGNRSAPRVGLLRPAGYRAPSGFGGGVTG